MVRPRRAAQFRLAVHDSCARMGAVAEDVQHGYKTNGGDSPRRCNVRASCRGGAHCGRTRTGQGAFTPVNAEMRASLDALVASAIHSRERHSTKIPAVEREHTRTPDAHPATTPRWFVRFRPSCRARARRSRRRTARTRSVPWRPLHDLMTAADCTTCRPASRA
jgi:hypothetical protein